MSTGRRRLGSWSAAAIGCAALVHAQQQPPTFRSSVDVVLVDAVVTSGGRPVADLTAADLSVTDNGVPQTILEVSRESMPIDLTVIFDSSSTAGAVFMDSLTGGALARTVARVTERLGKEDRLSLVSFSRGVREHMRLRPPSELGRLI